MIYLFDTNHLTYPARRVPDPEVVARIVEELQRSRAATASVCWNEAWVGVWGARSRRAEVWLRTLANAALAVLAYDRAAAELHAQLTRQPNNSPLGTRGQRDSAIAATAIANGAVLVTDNIAHFARYEGAGLSIENWVR